MAIELDLSNAVTMTATMAADFTPRIEADSAWHEGALFWQIEDSIDGDEWYQVTAGALTPARVNEVKRISSPLGLRARFAVQAVVARGRVATGEWEVCKASSCPFDHTGFGVTRARFRVAVRTI